MNGQLSENDIVHTSKGDFTRSQLRDMTFNKKYNLRPVKTLGDLQKVCDNFAKFLDINGCGVVFEHPNSHINRSHSVDKLYYYDLPTCFRIKKKDKSWIDNYVFLEYALEENGYVEFWGFSDMRCEDLEILPISDVVDYLTVRDEYVKMTCILNSYKIPNQFFIDNNFIKCLEKSWHNLGRKIGHR